MINEDRLFATFMALCAVDSEPKRERPMADCLTQRLSTLGFTVREDAAGEHIGGNAGNLFACLEATGPGRPVLFSCHMDRVEPGRGVKPAICEGAFVSDGTTVLGADDAAGLAAILEGVAVLREHEIPHPAIELVFSVAEELAVLGSRHFDLGHATAPYGFVLDAGGPVGEIIIQAPAQVKIGAVFHGRKAHAGFAPEQGISAIQMAAAAITRMELLRIDAETTANIGSIAALGPTNIVPDRCELEAEVRSLAPDKLLLQVERMTAAMQAAASDFGGRVEIETRPCYPSYRLSQDSAPARHAARAAERIGAIPRFRSTGGGSDANIFNDRGFSTVVLGCGYEAVHTTGERMPLEQLVMLARWVVALASEQPA